MEAMLAAALSYAARGWRVFPQAGKVPMIAGSRGVHDATADDRQIREWWRRYPNANIGLACGDEWWALDVDPRNGGDAAMRALVAKHGPLPDTVTSRTGGGGWHLLFRAVGVDFRSWCGGVCKEWPHRGVDIRARGVPITAPPSMHESGNPYYWVPGRGPDDEGSVIADPPAWLVELATPPPLPPLADIRDRIDSGWGPRPRYSKAALDDACARIRFAPDGCQEATLNREAFGIGRLITAGLMDENLARQWLIRAGTMMENYNSRKPWTEKLVRRKVDAALAAGKRRPNVRALQSA